MCVHTRRNIIAVDVSRTFRGARQLFYTQAPSFLSTPTPSPLSTYAQVSHSLPLIPDHCESIFILYIRRAVCVPARRLLHNVSARLARYKLGPRVEYSSGD